MKIKTKLQLIIITIIILFTGIASVSLLSHKQAEKQLKQQALIMELNMAIFERTRLREEYFIYREDRSKEQFLLMHKRIGGLLERMPGAFTGPEEKASVIKMTGFQSKIEGFFDQLVRLDQGATVHAATTQALRERIISQMLVNAHSMYQEGLKLLNAANEKTVYQTNLYRLYSNIVFGLLALFIAGFAVIIIRGITYPLARLHKGTERIARGNLDYKTNIRTPDEIGRLSTAFDAMTENLQKITVSRDELTKEIEERKQVEEALKRSEEAALLLAQETGVIAEIGRIISSSLDIEEVYERFADEVRKLIPFDRIIVNLVDQQEGTLTTAYRAGTEALGREKGVVFPIARTVTEEMMRTGTPMLLHLESIEELRDRFPGLVISFQAGLRSRLCLPLISRGEVIGSLALVSKQEKAYGERDLRLAQSVASQIAGAIANGQLFRERKRAEEKIRKSLKEKEVLLKEIHHRVKNNLQIISSLLFLQASRTEYPGAVSALQESRARVKSMALIHERLYQSPDLASVDMGEYTRNLVSDLQHSYRTEDGLVRFTLNIEAIPLGITEAIPCGLIINELVSNALKHAFPKGKEGEITIQLVRGNTNQVTLTVSDNGLGLPKHVDFRKSPSLGLTLVNSLVEQLDGAIELDQGGGTAFTITFG